MISFHRLICIICCLFSLWSVSFAQAPVVDDSENFAMLDDAPPIQDMGGRGQSSFSDEEQPLANDHSYTAESMDSARLLDKVQGLQQEVQELRGQLEVQSHDLKLLQQQQLAFYKDLDARLQPGKGAGTVQAKNDPTPPLEPQSPSLPTATPSPSKPTPTFNLQPTNNLQVKNNPAEEQISYLAAYELIKQKKYAQALTSMQAFVSQHPKGGYTANAHYWIGELFMAKNDYPNALQHFKVVLKDYSASSKASASMLKMGYAYAAMGQKNEAKKQLQDVIKRYPGSNTAQLAAAKLEVLNS